MAPFLDPYTSNKLLLVPNVKVCSGSGTGQAVGQGGAGMGGRPRDEEPNGTAPPGAIPGADPVAAAPRPRAARLAGGVLQDHEHRVLLADHGRDAVTARGPSSRWMPALTAGRPLAEHLGVPS